MAWMASSSFLPLSSPRFSSASSSQNPPPSSSSLPPSISPHTSALPISCNPSPALGPLSISASTPHHPSLPFANLLWFKGAFNAQVFVAENEPAESTIKRFRKAVMQAGVITECRRRRFFETPQDIKKRKRQALQRRRMKRFSPRTAGTEKKETPKANADDDDDYWGYVEDGVEVDL